MAAGRDWGTNRPVHDVVVVVVAAVAVATSGPSPLCASSRTSEGDRRGWEGSAAAVVGLPGLGSAAASLADAAAVEPLCRGGEERGEECAACKVLRLIFLLPGAS